MHTRLLLLVMTFGTLSAQNVKTWGGLSFGMTETQVRVDLGSRMLKVGPDEQPLDKSSHDFTGGKVRVTEIKGFEGDATLFFDKTSKKLAMVALFLTPIKDSSDEDKSFAYTRLREDLLKRYGPPVKRVECTEAEIETAPGPRTCKLIFRSEGQTIDAFMTSTNAGVPLIIHIVYEPIGANKGI